MKATWWLEGRHVFTENGLFQKRSTQEISAVQRGRGERIVSDNSKCIRTSEGGRG
jgi:hypothetical protein